MNVIVADDHLMIREGVKQTLSKIDGFHLLAEAASGAEALDAILGSPCDLAIVDINMPDLNGLDILQRVKAEKPEVRVVVLSMYSDGASVRQAADRGADGYILKDDEEEVFLSVLRNAAKGLRAFSPRVQRALFEKPPVKGRDPLQVLSDRELEIFRLLANGDAHKKIAGDLGISLRTVDFHITNIKDKLGTETTVDLIKIAAEYRLV